MIVTIEWKPLMKNILLAEGVGIVSGFLSMGTMQKFSALQKPWFAPQGWVFPVVWTMLFLLMGIAAYLVTVSHSTDKKKALTVYYAQLAVNFFWSILFFHLEMRLLAFFWILLLIVLVAYTTYLFYKIDKRAGYLMLPYLLWISFASVLNWSIYQLNK